MASLKMCEWMCGYMYRKKKFIQWIFLENGLLLIAGFDDYETT